MSYGARNHRARIFAVARDDAILDVKGERASVRVASLLDEQTPYDLVIVTLLAQETDALQRSAAKCIRLMFNTLQPERLPEAIGIDRCALGRALVQATLDGNGRLKATIGAAGQKTMASQQRWVGVFNAAGLPAAFDRDMPPWLRCHVPLCVAFESVSVVGERRGGGASWAEALVLARGVHTSLDLIKRLGHPVGSRTKKLIDRSPASVVAAMLWSMSRIRSFRELLATGKAECRALVDATVAAAPLAKSPVIVSDVQAMKPS